MARPHNASDNVYLWTSLVRQYLVFIDVFGPSAPQRANCTAPTAHTQELVPNPDNSVPHTASFHWSSLSSPPRRTRRSFHEFTPTRSHKLLGLRQLASKLVDVFGLVPRIHMLPRLVVVPVTAPGSLVICAC